MRELGTTKAATMGRVPNLSGLKASIWADPTATSMLWTPPAQAMDIILTGLDTHGLLLMPNMATDRAFIQRLETSPRMRP